MISLQLEAESSPDSHSPSPQPPVLPRHPLLPSGELDTDDSRAAGRETPTVDSPMQNACVGRKPNDRKSTSRSPSHSSYSRSSSSSRSRSPAKRKASPPSSPGKALKNPDRKSQSPQHGTRSGGSRSSSGSSRSTPPPPPPPPKETSKRECNPLLYL